MAANYDVALKVAARTAIRTLLETKTAPLKFVILNASNGVLGEIPLQTPCCTVNGTTGQLTFNVVTPSTATCTLAGTAVTAALRNTGSTTNWITIDCKAGTAAEAGYFVLTTVDLTLGAPLELVSATVG
jgi:hypothetical protein